MISRLTLACLLIASPAMATQLQGEQRASMIKQAASGCLDNNVKKPDNRPYTLAVVDAFCTCIGTGTVDRFSIEELVQAGEKMTPDFEKRRAVMTSKCAADTFGKAKPK
jgi:hypothetical protein